MAEESAAMNAPEETIIHVTNDEYRWPTWLEEKIEHAESIAVNRPSPRTALSIYRVPDSLRELNKEAYTPQLISIGPFHYHSQKLQAMENLKLRYFRRFMERITKINKEKLASIIQDSEEWVRGCYAEALNSFDRDTLRQIILVDASFIIGFFLRYWSEELWRDDNLIVEAEPWALLSRMKLDLILLENQLPFFIIEKLYELLPLDQSPSTYPSSFLKLTFNFFENQNVQKIRHDEVDSEKVMHFVDLLRYFYLPPNRRSLPARNLKVVNEMYCASQLAEAGLKFKPSSSRSILDLKFNEGVLEIPIFTLHNNTEIYARNLIALEQCVYPIERYVTDYFIMLDFLINKGKDVDLLVQEGILVNEMGINNIRPPFAGNLCTGICIISEGIISEEVSFSMESSDDEKDGVLGNYIPTELTRVLASSGVKFVDQVLNGQNELCLENFRMDKHVFYKLCDILQAKGLLRHTNRIKIEEQLAIFMFVIGHNLRTRAVQELFRYSGETISRHFNNVLNAIMAISLDFFQPPGSDVPPEILEDPRFYPYFQDCVGAVDGIHIPVMVGVDEQGPFRNKNGMLSQNVLAACSFDLKFHYVLAGWEGSASDLQVLNSALTRRNKLQVPKGKYYLVDNKYANMAGFIAPYPDVPYYLKEYPIGYQPQDVRELFNERHSLLRNATDRTFGALKARFPILMSAPPYPLQTQVKLVVAACAIHNYIRREKPDDWIFKMYEQEGTRFEDSLPPLDVEQPIMHIDTQDPDIGVETEELEISSQMRDSIATEMWNDYIHDFSAM